MFMPDFHIFEKLFNIFHDVGQSQLSCIEFQPTIIFKEDFFSAEDSSK
jgi:hypothetical protein